MGMPGIPGMPGMPGAAPAANPSERPAEAPSPSDITDLKSQMLALQRQIEALTKASGGGGKTE